MKISDLTLEEKIGQLFMVGLESDLNETIDMVTNYKLGGVILYKRNYSNYEEMIKLINKIKCKNSANKVPIFISIDQEGGRVNRMPSEIKNLKSATQIIENGDINIVRKSGTIIGEMLYKSGISMDYAPVLDIKRFKENHPIGDRCYGETKEDVAKYAIEVMNEINRNNVIAVVKHFPGHGLTKKDSHFQIPKIKEKIETVEKVDMFPFEVAIKSNTDAIMVGHLMVEDIDKKYPASLSEKIIKKYLIDKYNFKGLIITDDMKMLAIRIHYNMKRAVKRAINAGNDIIMIGLPYKKTQKVIEYIIKQVQKGEISQERLDESVKKILDIKEKYNVNDQKVEGFNIEEINKKIQDINNIVVKQV